METTMQTTKQTEKKVVLTQKQRTFKEITMLLDSSWDINLLDTSIEKIAQLDKALGSPSKKVKAVFVGGSNGKSLTINYTTQLLTNEGLKVGSFYSPHFASYNERIAENNASIANQAFTDVANEVINTAASLNKDFHAKELLTMIALNYFVQKNVDVVLLEVSNNSFDPTMICTPIISGITRITNYDENASEEEIKPLVNAYQSLIHKNSWVISADQNKANLFNLQSMTEKTNGHWAMPIRKLAALPYPFEQLHGRCAALAERIAQIFVQEFAAPQTIIVNESLLAKPKGQRGRPTLEAKRQAELNPKKTVEQFWHDASHTIHSRFDIITDHKPSILLDNANNVDALKNLFLGIRLLNYEKKFKGLVIIVGCENNDLLNGEFYKLVRYFFKKTNGQIIFCPVTKDAQNQNQAWNVEQITNDVKNTKIKAKSTTSFIQAFEHAKKVVDEEQGLIVITGSRAVISEYWHTTNSKK
jgi:dihydrofolate synthase / folylpolyglutamate synthase